MGVFVGLLTVSGQAIAQSGSIVFSTADLNNTYTTDFLGDPFAGIADAAVGLSVHGRTNVFFGGVATVGNTGASTGFTAIGATDLTTLTLCDYCAVTVTESVYLRGSAATGLTSGATNEHYVWVGPNNSTAPGDATLAAEGLRVGGTIDSRRILIQDFGNTTQVSKTLIDLQGTEANYQSTPNTWFTYGMTIQRRNNDAFLLTANQNNRILNSITNTNISQLSGYSAAWLNTGFRVGMASDDYASSVSYVITTPQLKITNTAISTQARPGQTVVFEVRVQNTGTLPVAGFTITDTLDANFSSANWTCTGQGGAVCPAVSGKIVGGLPITSANIVPPNGSLIFTVNATVVARPTALLSSTASLLVPSTDYCDTSVPTCAATATLGSSGIITVDKTTTTTTIVPNAPVTYTIVLGNVGGTTANNVSITDLIPAGLNTASWTCTNAGGASGCPLGTSTGDISASGLTLPAGSQITLTLQAIVDGTPPTTVANTVSVNPGSAVCDLVKPTCTDTAYLSAVGVLQSNKQVTPSTAKIGDEISFTISMINLGGGTATGVSLTDLQLPDLSAYMWSCQALNGAICPGGITSGTGALNVTNYTLPAQGALIYSLIAVVESYPANGQILNTFTINAGGGAICADAAQTMPCLAHATLRVLSDALGIPTLSGSAIMGLSVLLGIARWRRRRAPAPSLH